MFSGLKFQVLVLLDCTVSYCYGLPMLILSFRLSLDDARKFFLVCLVRGPVWNLVGVLSIRFRGLWG